MSRRWVVALALGCAGASQGCDLSYLGPGCFGSCVDGGETDSTVGDAGSDAHDAPDSEATDTSSDSSDSGVDATADTSADSGVESGPDAETYYEVIGDAGTLAWYRFEETPGATAVKDWSGNGYDGLYDPSTGPTLGVPGIVGRAARFVASGSGVSIADHVENKLAFSGTTPFSIEAWVSLDTAPTKPSTIAQKEIFQSGSWNGWVFFVDGTGMRFQRLGAASVVDEIFTPYAFTPTTWRYLVVTYDGSSLHAYLDGVSVKDVSATTSLPLTTQALGIGTDSPATSDEGFPGAIDELAIYTRVLTYLEIQHHYLAAK